MPFSVCNSSSYLKARSLKGELLAEEKPARWPRKRVLPSQGVNVCGCCLAASSSWWICAVMFLKPAFGGCGPDDGSVLGRTGKGDRGDPGSSLGLEPRTPLSRSGGSGEQIAKEIIPYSNHVCPKLSTDSCRHRVLRGKQEFESLKASYPHL